MVRPRRCLLSSFFSLLCSLPPSLVLAVADAIGCWFAWPSVLLFKIDTGNTIHKDREYCSVTTNVTPLCSRPGEASSQGRTGQGGGLDAMLGEGRTSTEALYLDDSCFSSLTSLGFYMLV